MAKKVRDNSFEDWWDEEWELEGDDGEAAFWDEFFWRDDQAEQEMEGRTYTIKVVDEETGEEQEFKGIRLGGVVRKRE